MKKLNIPKLREATPSWVMAVFDNIQTITGRKGKIDKLPTTATNAEVISKVNELLDRLQQ